jgi:serine/threonine protein phosphatase PrpC
MLRVAEQYAATDTGRQRRANEDSMFSRSPLFVVADGMGGAQAGEVASRIAVEAFHEGLPDVNNPELGLAANARAANDRIHELSQTNAEQAGMGTTLTAVWVGEEEISIAHVGDSRAYCLRDGELLRLTDDHSLVDELIRQGKLTPEEAEEHPQRSIITRALGPEPTVEVDTRSFRARPGDIYLLCSDGLTTMVSEAGLTEILLTHASLRDTGEALIASANELGGRDNITVILLRVEEVALASATVDGERQRERAHVDEHTTLTGVPAVTAPAPDPDQRGIDPSPQVGDPERSPRGENENAGPPPDRSPRRPRSSSSQSPGSLARQSSSRSRLRRARTPFFTLVVIGFLAAGAYVASQSVYFIGTNARGLVTVFRGVPYELPGGVKLYSKDYVSGVSAATLTAQRRHTLLDHSLRAEGDATDLLRSLELDQLSGG